MTTKKRSIKIVGTFFSYTKILFNVIYSLFLEYVVRSNHVISIGQCIEKMRWVLVLCSWWGYCLFVLPFLSPTVAPTTQWNLIIRGKVEEIILQTWKLWIDLNILYIICLYCFCHFPLLFLLPIHTALENLLKNSSDHLIDLSVVYRVQVQQTALI